jgi:diguanylate cyclase (GGDEF)-like protein
MSTPSSSSTLRWQVIWLFAVGITVVVAFLAVRDTAESRVRHETNAVAVGYARVLASAVRDLPRFLESGWMSWNTSYDLERLTRIDGVFRFQLFDVTGRLLLRSEDLNSNTIDWTWVNLKDHYAADQRKITNPSVLAGETLITLHTGKPDTNWPHYYSDARVPFILDGKMYGVVRVFVDQTSRHQGVTQDYLRIGLVGALLLTGLLIVGFLHWRDGQKKREAIEEKIRYLARYDVLSGALNRASFDSMIDAAVEHYRNTGQTFAVHYFDLDNFKAVNDNYGHTGGDQILQQASERLREFMTPTDHLARIGGDEFVMLQTNMEPGTPVKKMADQILHALRQPFEIDGDTVQCGASIGVAIFHVGVPNAHQLVQRADLALYAAKSDGGDSFRLYSEELQEQIKIRERFIEDLAQAVKDEDFELFYQPLFESTGQRVTGYEALLRWTHPVNGPVSPAEFVPIAEEAGLINEMGSWVLRQACADLAQWPDHLTVAVNLSVAQFEGGDLVREVSDQLAKNSLEPNRLEIEITESLMMSNTERVMRILHGLKALGVGISMDDYGTGYSSLAYLWRFPFDKLKIDRAFTMNMEEDPKVDLIINSIVSLAHSMNIRVNAEGVETQAQLDALHGHGCDELQGFFLGRPAPVSKLNHYPNEPAPQATATDDATKVQTGESASAVGA